MNEIFNQSQSADLREESSVASLYQQQQQQQPPQLFIRREIQPIILQHRPFFFQAVIPIIYSPSIEMLFCPFLHKILKLYL